MTTAKTDSTESTFQTGLGRNVWVLSLTSFLNDISSDMILNLLPLYLVNVLGVRTVVVGVIEGIAESTASLVKVFSGALSDRLGQRKRLTVLGYALSALSKPMLYFANAWGWVLGVRFTDRVGKGIRTAPRDALLADSMAADRRGAGFGFHRASDTAGAFLGIAVAAGFIWATQTELTRLTQSTFRLIVLASAVPAVLAVLVLLVWARDIPIERQAQPQAGFRLQWSGLDWRFRAFLVVLVLFTLGNFSDAFVILRGQERGLNLLQVMGMLLTFTAFNSLLSTPLGSLSDRIGRGRLLVGGWLAHALIYFGLAAAGSGWQIWILFALHGAYYAATDGVSRAFVADLVSPTQRGTAYGFYNATIGLTVLPASLAAGALWQGVGRWPGWGPAAPFYAGAALALLAVGLFIVWVRPAQAPPG